MVFLFVKCLFLAIALFGRDGLALLRAKKPILLDPPANVSLKSTRISTNLYFEQKIDNFNPIDTRTYKQRYHVNEDYYNATSKNHVFLLLGGEWEATPSWLNYGAWIDTAKQYGALLIYLEHRYYGLSQPFSDWSTANLQYLSAHQALEDAAHFIQGMNQQYNLSVSDAKWIVFGGSYAGTLATWLRHKYPHLVAGAMSSSGPLEAILDFHDYLRVVRESLETHSTTCTSNVKEAFSQLETVTASCLEDEDIYKEIDEAFQLCETIETSEGNDKDIATLFESIVDNVFAYVVQYNNMTTYNIDAICTVMVNQTGNSTLLDRLAEANSLMLKAQGESCTDYKYESFISSLRNTTIVSSSLMRQWFYQTCTEFGFFQTTSQEDPIFGSRFDVTYFTDVCIDVFGDQFNETLTNLGIKATNNRYGATNIAVSNIVHFHGRIDPWHALGKLETTSDVGDRVIIVDDVAHCANMRAPTDNDSPALTAARKEIDQLIGQWLGIETSTTGGSSTFVPNNLGFLAILATCLYYVLF